MQRLLRRGAAVAFVPEPLTTKREVNPEAVWTSDRSRAYAAARRNLENAVGWLAARGALDGPRRDAAGRRFFRIVQWEWAGGCASAEQVAAFEARLDPDGAWLRRGLSPLRRLVYAALRTRPGQALYPPAAALRRWWITRRAGARPAASAASPPARPAPPAAAPRSRPRPPAPAARG